MLVVFLKYRHRTNKEKSNERNVEEIKLWKNTASNLKGSFKRQFMARVVNLIGRGGQSFAEKHLGWSRPTIRKGQKELASGQAIEDRFGDRGRKNAEERYPDLLSHIRSIVEPIGQADPTFSSTRTYIPLTARSVYERLLKEFGYKNEFLSARTIANKLKKLGYRPMKVKKCRPIKKIPETDAIFEEVHRINREADEDEGTLRISLDTKATVKIGEFVRNGTNRNPHVKGFDHDFEPDEKLTPFGIFLPQFKESYLWFSTSRVTADFMADCLEEAWPKLDQQYRPHTLVINADNGPENNGQRTQWLKRLVKFSQAHDVTIQLAYYPPYHSKYNPVERLWGVLENHWRGEILSTVQKALGLARTMTYDQIKPAVKLSRKIYETGVTVLKEEMNKIEEHIDRNPLLEKWFIKICPL